MMQADQFDWSRVSEIGAYTVPTASRLIGADPTKLRSWLDGYAHSGAAPIIRRQIPRVGKKTVIGFLDLMEARFIRHFQAHGFSPQTIRKVSNKLRERHDVDHPFAMDKRFRTDGRAIFMESVENEDELRVLNLMNDNFEMAEVIERSLFDSVFYINDLAAHWSPLEDVTPLVIVHPKFSFGRPVIRDVWVPTATLYKAYLVEGSICATADEFEIDKDAVRQAIHFEQELAKGTIH
jgi:uncharacterized protein (DUF433 family)